MSKMTLLEVVQDVCSDLNLDLVDAIDETVDSSRVASIARSVYFEMMARRDWPHLMELTELDNGSDVNARTRLLIPENVSRIEWITYNCLRDGETRDRRRALCYQYPDEFIARANNLNRDNPNVIENVSSNGAKFLIRTDKQPQYWTSFTQDSVVLDSFDQTVEATSQGNKTQVLLYRTPVWSHDDLYVPDMPVEAFPGYLAEVKSVAALRINEVADQKAEQQAVRQQRRLSNQSWRAHGGIRKPNYGRIPRGSYTSRRNPIFGRDS